MTESGKNAVITSVKNESVRRVKRLLRDSALRRETGLFGCEGEVLLAEALSSGIELECALRAPNCAIPELPSGVTVLTVSPDVLESVSVLKCPRGVVFTARLPKRVASLDQNGYYIALDCVQDPGNAGSIARLAEAFGFDGVLHTNGTADLFSPKALRGSMGSAFRVPLRGVTPEELRGLRVVCADLSGDDIRNVKLPPCVLVIGSEGQGVSAAVRSICARTVRIPMSGKVQSLNALSAASVLAWHIACGRGATAL